MQRNTRLNRCEFVKGGVLAASALGLFISAAPASAASQPMKTDDLRAAMRKLWEDHITWTRLYIVSAAANIPDRDVTAARLLQNQVDIGDAIKPYYGDAAGNRLTSLLKTHILDAVDLITAAKEGDQGKAQSASAKWYANANDIALFLSGANPSAWPADQMKAQMKMHLDLTLEEATARLQGKYQADIAAYDKVHGHILRLADVLSSGIVSQFPNKFS